VFQVLLFIKILKNIELIYCIYITYIYISCICLEVKNDKTKYMVMSRDQNAGQTRNIKTDSSYFERVEQFKYL